MKRPNIELRRFRHVVAAAEHGSFPRAAAALTNRAPLALARWSAEILGALLQLPQAAVQSAYQARIQKALGLGWSG
jgi:hypothetical protein